MVRVVMLVRRQNLLLLLVGYGRTTSVHGRRLDCTESVLFLLLLELGYRGGGVGLGAFEKLHHRVLDPVLDAGVVVPAGGGVIRCGSGGPFLAGGSAEHGVGI
uniref:(northern house mosquito) hypothetical protein n=1 Tax=Culex pipiens TaxID=7175 RepID=A0A8D8AMA6_CULPI